MTYTFYELLWLFFAYSFAGWILETVGSGSEKKNLCEPGTGKRPLMCDLWRGGSGHDPFLP